MAVSPLPLLTIIMLTLVGEALLFGDEIASRSFPTFEEPTSGGFFGAIDAILSVVQVIWGGVLFFFNLITFNVPDAPFWVRVPTSAILGGGLVWSIATLIRGN